MTWEKAKNTLVPYREEYVEGQTESGDSTFDEFKDANPTERIEKLELT